MKIQIKVIPSSHESRIVSQDPFVVKLKSSADKGKANSELLKVLEKHFGRKVRITSGFSGRKKIVEVY